MHYLVGSLFLAILMSTFGLLPASMAQEATPERGFADLGLPQQNVTVSATAMDGIPQTLDAGRYLLNVTTGDDTGFGGVEFVQPVGGITEESLDYFAPVSGDSATQATPAPAEDQATPASGEEATVGVEQLLFESLYAGGIHAPAGGTAQAVIDLAPGQWIAHGGFGSTQEAVIVDVTGEMPTDLPEPEASATLTMHEYVIEVSEGELSAGTQVVKVENIGAQPHYILAAYTTADLTKDDVDAMVEAGITGTPAAVDFNPDEDFQDSFFTGIQSTGAPMWMIVDLQPGAYVLFCFFTDRDDGLPHHVHGMYELVEVGD